MWEAGRPGQQAAVGEGGTPLGIPQDFLGVALVVGGLLHHYIHCHWEGLPPVLMLPAQTPPAAAAAAAATEVPTFHANVHDTHDLE